MLFVRVFDAKAIALQRTGKLGTYAAASATRPRTSASAASMQARRRVRAEYREYGAQFMRGVQAARSADVLGRRRARQRFLRSRARLRLVRADRDAVPACGRRGARVQAAQGAARRGHRAVGDGGSSKADFYGAINSAGAYSCRWCCA